MKKLFSLLFVFCLAFTGIMLVGCKDDDKYLYKVDGLQIESVEIERNDLTGDFEFEVEIVNKSKENKTFDFGLFELRVDNDKDKIVEANTSKQTVNARADKDFSFVLDEEDVLVNNVRIGSSISVYYGGQFVATVLVGD